MRLDVSQDIEQLIALFEQGRWSQLDLQTKSLGVFLSTNPAAVKGGRVDALAEHPAVDIPVVLPATALPAPPLIEASSRPSPDPALSTVLAPHLGTFYRSAKPGSAPFVEEGQDVTPETEVCLLEVMKLFTSVKAGVAGTIERIVATDADLVEGGQVLFYIKTR